MKRRADLFYTADVTGDGRADLVYVGSSTLRPSAGTCLDGRCLWFRAVTTLATDASTRATSCRRCSAKSASR